MLINTLQNPLHRKILLVEDNRMDEVLIRYKIESLLPNAQIITVGSVHEAYRAYKDHDFDMILMDLNLPGSFGSGSVTQASLFNGNAPIVVLTGCASPATLSDVMAQGAAHILHKSDLMSAAFIETLEKYLE